MSLAERSAVSPAQPLEQRRNTHQYEEIAVPVSLDALAAGKYVFTRAIKDREGNEERKYKVYAFVPEKKVDAKQEKEANSASAWVILGGAMDYIDPYADVCDKLATQSGKAVLYIEHDNKIPLDRREALIEAATEDLTKRSPEQDTIRIVSDLQIKGANLVAHSLSTIDIARIAATEEGRKLFRFVVLAAPVGLEKMGVLKLLKRFLDNHFMAVDMSQKETEEGQRTKAAIGNVLDHRGEAVKKARDKIVKIFQTRKGELRGLLVKIAQENVDRTDEEKQVVVAVIVPPLDPYTSSEALISLQGELDAIAGEDPRPDRLPNITLVTPSPKVVQKNTLAQQPETAEELDPLDFIRYHNFFYANDPDRVAQMLLQLEESLLELAKPENTMIVEHPGQLPFAA